MSALIVTVNDRTSVLVDGQSGTLRCAGLCMPGNFIVTFNIAGSFTYNGVTTKGQPGSVSGLACAGKIMATDIVITAGETVEEPALGTKIIDANDIYYAEDDDLDGYSCVVVNVPTQGATDITTESPEVDPEKYTQVITPIGADYLAQVTVHPIPDTYIEPTGTFPITENGTYPISGYESVSVAVLGESESPLPTEVSSELVMTSILNTATEADNGRIYKYVGPTGTYTQNSYYRIEVKSNG